MKKYFPLVSLILCGLVILSYLLLGCDVAGEKLVVPPLEDFENYREEGRFYCYAEGLSVCEGNIHHKCKRKGEFLQETRVDCQSQGLICVSNMGCATCVPDQISCQGNTVVHCLSDGSGYKEKEECDIEHGYACVRGTCKNLCQIAETERSYVGCEFYAADLDNAAIDAIDDASNQQYAVVVSNLHQIPTEVWVEINQAKVGEPLDIHEVIRTKVPPRDLEVFELPRREVDGSSQDGIDDGTHTALTSNAYRISASHPIIAYQFNPLDNVNVFSNEASLLLPTSAIGSKYTVVGWPQTIGDSEDPFYDFDHTSSDEDLRAFLTIIGTEKSTHLEIEAGPNVVEVVGADPIPQLSPNDTFEIEIGPFDVVNLETQGFMADFTGTLIKASNPVSVFVGSEASDVPIYRSYSTRQCCADHLEEQLFPNSTLGTYFIISRMPPRTTALNRALIDPKESVAEVNEPEYIRIVAVEKGETGILTTLEDPNDGFTIDYRDFIDIKAEQDFMFISDKPVAVLQALPSQQVVGISKSYPGGDPAIIAVPPVEQYRDNYIFLTPNNYAFDFITITAEPTTQVLLDDQPLPDHCTETEIEGTLLGRKESLPTRLVYRCQLSFPNVKGPPNPEITEGLQLDGVHKIVADQPIGLIIYGFDRFVSYAYAGGLNLDILI